LGNVWSEKPLSIQQKQHPHQKPKELIRELILSTTNQGDLIVDPCAGSFIVLEVCQELNRNYLGCDLTFNLMNDYQRERERESEIAFC
jgi:site-specific DNA-methyltransferase (adenine-specific)